MDPNPTTPPRTPIVASPHAAPTGVVRPVLVAYPDVDVPGMQAMANWAAVAHEITFFERLFRELPTPFPPSNEAPEE